MPESTFKHFAYCAPEFMKLAQRYSTYLKQNPSQQRGIFTPALVMTASEGMHQAGMKAIRQREEGGDEQVCDAG